MLRRMSEASAGFLKRRDVISDEKWNVYVYGFEVIYSTLICFASIFMFGWFGRRVFQTFLFLLYFTLIRIFAGGYHAKTYGGCFLATNAAYLLEWLLAGVTAPYLIVQWCILLVSVIYIWNKAPVKNPHRELSEEKREKNRRRARICLTVCILSMLALQAAGFRGFMPEIASTTAVVAMMILITFII